MALTIAAPANAQTAGATVWHTGSAIEPLETAPDSKSETDIKTNGAGITAGSLTALTSFTCDPEPVSARFLVAGVAARGFVRRETHRLN
jgi:hypothetical protein